jgi:hypothetical protein
LYRIPSRTPTSPLIRTRNARTVRAGSSVIRQGRVDASCEDYNWFVDKRVSIFWKRRGS